MTSISFSEKSVVLGDTQIVCDHKVEDAFLIGETLIVLLDSDANIKNKAGYQNLFGYNLEGKQLWVAELPTSKKADVYYKIQKKRNTLSPWSFSLIAYSFCSYECEIDIKTGKIIKSVFYK